MTAAPASSRPGWGFAVGLALACLGCAAAVKEKASPGARRAESLISQQTLDGAIRFLADDALEGRAPGTPGDELARRYIASAMALIGLAPGASDSTEQSYEQRLELVGITTLTPRQWTFTGPGGRVSLRNVEDFVAVSGKEQRSLELDDAELVFVGYGIQAPEYGWDDFKGMDLRGKVLVMLNDDPDWDPKLFAGRRRLYYGRWTYKYESAARQGAAGAILIHTTESASYPWQTVQTSWSGENSRLPAHAGPELEVQAWVTEPSASKLAKLAGKNLDELVDAARSREFAPVPLGVRTSLRLQTKTRRYATANVIGVLPGSDPKLRGQYVVYTAHHDHLGAKRGADGKLEIYNGALDNAAGVGKLLAVARAFTALPSGTRRSILFLAPGAEEQGLLGSEFYVSNPTVAPRDMVAVINFDGANIWGATKDITIVGSGKSTLDDLVAAAAASQGRVLEDDPFPERGSFYRSDHFNFARAGVPALFLQSGTSFVGRPESWGRDEMHTWVTEHYHQPSDDYDPGTWSFAGMVEDARLAFRVGLELAQSSTTPSWRPGDEFEGARKASQTGASDRR